MLLCCKKHIPIANKTFNIIPITSITIEPACEGHQLESDPKQIVAVTPRIIPVPATDKITAGKIESIFLIKSLIVSR